MEDKRKILNDIILVSAIFLFSLIAFLVFYLTRSEGSSVSVTVDGVEVGSYSLLTDRSERIDGYGGGYNVLIIEGGEAYICEADCPDGICSKRRPIKYSGSTIVCLPNKVVVTVVGDSGEPEVDVVS